MSSLKYTVEFQNRMKFWEIGFERSDANDTMPYETKGNVEAYSNACLAEGINVRVWIEIEDGCDEACKNHMPNCDGNCKHLPGHVNECMHNAPLSELAKRNELASHIKDTAMMIGRMQG